MNEWWVNNCGENLLKGLPGDSNNPARLPDDYILAFLSTIPAARASYVRLANTLSAEEQERLSVLYNRALSAAQTVDEKAHHDRIQNSWNRSGVHTAGRRGGTRIGGNR